MPKALLTPKELFLLKAIELAASDDPTDACYGRIQRDVMQPYQDWLNAEQDRNSDPSDVLDVTIQLSATLICRAMIAGVRKERAAHVLKLILPVHNEKVVNILASIYEREFSSEGT